MSKLDDRRSIKDKIKNYSLINTSTWFLGISLVISCFVPLLLFIFFIETIEQTNGEFLFTIISTAISGILIPIYKILSFHQNVEASLGKKLNTSVRYLKEKYITYTESILLLLTSSSIIMNFTYHFTVYMMSDDDRSLIMLFIFLVIIVVIATIFVIFSICEIKKKKADKKVK